MSRRDFSQQFPTHRDFSQQFPTHSDYSQQFPTHHDFTQQFPSSSMTLNAPVNTPSEDIFPVFTPDNEPVANPPVVQQPEQVGNNPHVEEEPVWTGLTDEALFQQDMEELLRVQAEEERLARAREAYLRAKQARRKARAERRWQMGLTRVPSSEDDSSASYSSNEGYVSDDSFF